MSNRPAWRQAYDSWEKAVAPGLEQLTASAGFRDVVATAARVNATVAKEAERASRQWLHLWNLPAASDVRRLRRQVAGLEQELQLLRHALARASSAQGAAGRPDLSLVDDPDAADVADTAADTA